MKLKQRIARLTTAALFAASLFTVLKPFSADAAGESLSLTSAEGKPGETVTLDIMVECNDNFGSLDAVLLWSDNALKAEPAEGKNGVTVASTTGDGYCTISAFTIDEKLNDGSLAEINFTIPADAKNGTIYSIDYSRVDSLTTYDGEDITDFTVSGGTITVTGSNTENTDSTENTENTENTGNTVNNESLSLTSAKGKPGETVTLDVKVECNDSLESMIGVITWDDTSLRSKEAVGAARFATVDSTVGDGFCTLALFSIEAVKDGTIAKIDFTIPENAEAGTIYSINFAEVNSFTIYEGDDIANMIRTSGGTIEVLDSAITTTSVTTAATTTSTTVSTTVSDVSTTTVTTTEPANDDLLGDANQDHIVNIRDAAFIARAAARGQLDTLPSCADYNRDGKANIRDAAALARDIANGKFR